MEQSRHRFLAKGIPRRTETSSSHREPAHPTPMTYVRIAMVLGAITLVEFGALYVDALRSIVVPIFIVLSAIKFALVAMFYMHLKFDARLFSWLFVGGVVLAGAIIIALMGLFEIFVG